jgi:2-(1,2-epoxy-1,2-dihydrophenyl)acetyl-CoA isomerase
VPDQQPLQWALDAGVLRLTINRPDAGNAITRAMRLEIIERLADAGADNDVRVVLINAAGKHFCTGADLRADLSGPKDADGNPRRQVGDIRRTMLTGAQLLVQAILDCEKPVLAAIQGTAAGLGAHLAFACDLTLAGESAKFIEIFARRGLAADSLGTWLLPRLVGLTRARELVLLAEDVPAARAAEIGLITRVVADDGLAAAADTIATTLAAAPSRALAFDKWMLNRSLDVDRQTSAHEEALAVELLSTSYDAQEGVASFVERRSVAFKGF